MFTTRKRSVFGGAAIIASAALVLGACASGDNGATPGEPVDPTVEEVTLNFAFWGNDVRAGFYNEALDAFMDEYPNITVNSTFLGFPEFWEARQIEAAGGGLPDVMQFDYSYMRQYSENGLLLDLGPYLGDIIDTSGISDEILSIGVVGGVTTGIATSTNAWGMYTNPILADELGVESYPGGGSWDDYNDWINEVSGQLDGHWGGTDWTGRIQNFEIQLRAEGGNLFTEDGQPGFDEARLLEFWQQGEAIRNGGAIPGQRLEEIAPVSGFDAALTLTELTWDNFGAGYLGNLGEPYTSLGLVEPPIHVEGARDLYLKPSMLHTISAGTDHPEAAALLVNFLVNSPEVGSIFGTNRGLPASQTQLAGADLGELDAQIRDYEASIADRLGDAPPVPIVGYGSIEETFRQIGAELGLGTITPEQAVERFFTEMNVILNN